MRTVFENEGPRAKRRQATIDEVLAAAWEVVHADGLAALSMRDLANRVGMKAPSLYQYFPSKLDIYDALFAEGHRQLQAALAALDRTGDPVEVFRRGSHIFTDFCLEDAVRYQLLFQRTIPGFVPSEASMALASASFADMAGALAAAGISDPARIDLWAAIQMGLNEMQLANDPGGRRFADLLDAAIDLFLAAAPPRRGRR
jgi:AcrR family transcriptional regulator